MGGGGGGGWASECINLVYIPNYEMYFVYLASQLLYLCQTL